MAWVRGTPIVADVAALRRFLGRQDLADLESNGELDLARDLLTQASDAVFAWLKSKGFDPNAITNLDDYRRIVARFAEATLMRAGQLSPPEGREAPMSEWEWVRQDLDAVQPEIAAKDVRRRHQEGLPRVWNPGGGSSYF